MLSPLSWLRGQLWNTLVSPTISSFWIVLDNLDVVGSFLANTGPISRSLNGLGYSPRWPRRVFPTSGFELVPDSDILEEEMFEHFHAGDYYPVRIGDVYKNGQYQVVGKLGFGVSSTAWLAADRMEHRYVTLKIFARGEAGAWEAAVADHIKDSEKEGFGRDSIRKVLDEFELPRDYGDNYCLVQEPLGSSLGDFLRLYGRVREPLVQSGVGQMLRGLCYLHLESFLIHTDLKADHIMQLVTDPSDFTKFVSAEFENPTPRKFVYGHPVYKSRRFGNLELWGIGKLCDFGHVIPGEAPVYKMAQPDCYRAPEILLRAPWGYPIDIWNLALLAWHLIQGEPLFKGRELDPETDYVFHTDRCHLAEIVEVLGPPPPEVLEQGAASDTFFDKYGSFKFEGADILRPVVYESTGTYDYEGLDNKKRELKDELTALKGESKERFLDFMSQALTWDPEKRISVDDMFFHPWLRALDNSGEGYDLDEDGRIIE